MAAEDNLRVRQAKIDKEVKRIESSKFSDWGKNILFVAIALAVLALGIGGGIHLATKSSTKPVAKAIQAPTQNNPAGNPGGEAPVVPQDNGLTNPVLHHSPECAPEITSGCSYDVGVHVDQVGIVFGVDISWNGNGPFDGRCDMVVLAPDNWFENLHLLDARAEVYTVPSGDIPGWQKVLTNQRAAEQEADYSCPHKTAADVPVWSSGIVSPPNPAAGHGSSTSAMGSGSSGSSSSSTSGSGSTSSNCAVPETVDCKARISTADAGRRSIPFAKGDAVYGYLIKAGGRSYTNCWFKSAPGGGSVTDGVIHPWRDEVKSARQC